MIKLLLRLIARFLTYKVGGVYYINSTNILPAPLSEKEELALLLRVKEGDIEARNTLIIHNLRLVVFIAKKFEGTKINLEDLISIGSMGLIKGVQTFKLEKNIKLATYASRCIENEILMHLRKTYRMRQEISLDEVLSVDSEGNEMVLSDVLGDSDSSSLTKLTEEEKKERLYQAIEHLSKREKEIITMRFGLFGHEIMTQKEVADLLGISQSYISRLEKRIIDKMRQEIETFVRPA
ncbi:MAG TPA: sigma-70 family RNA polymerase sigma factor [Bacilli bacterium]|nr:sigma-70 family RNA polymerase sigma factor [Bacilli bacterium]